MVIINRFDAPITDKDGNSFLAMGYLFRHDLVDFVIFKDVAMHTNLAIKLDNEYKEGFTTGPCPFKFSNGVEKTGKITYCENMPDRCSNGYWHLIFNVEDIPYEYLINEAILGCGYWSGYLKKHYDMTVKALEGPDVKNDIAWIPFTPDTMPKHSMPCYVTCKSIYDDRPDWVIESLYIKDEGFEPDELIMKGTARITAWMPKYPSPYKEEKRKED